MNLAPVDTNAGLGETDWIIEKDRPKYDVIFDKLGPFDGKITGAGDCFT